MRFFENLGLLRYISCLAISDFLIGNSSSGILEAPLGVTLLMLALAKKGDCRQIPLLMSHPSQMRFTNMLLGSQKTFNPSVGRVQDNFLVTESL